MTPAFDPQVFEYSATVSRDVTSIVVNAVPNNLQATVSIDGADELSSGENIVSIHVLAQDGIRWKDYRIFVNRQENYIPEGSGFVDTFGVTYTFMTFPANLSIPEGFTQTTRTINGYSVPVFAKDGIHNLFRGMRDKKWGILGIIPACLLGIASPLCMYGTIPIAASFARQGMREDWLAAFMMASILLNPQLIIYSAALGPAVLAIRIVSCFLCGIAAGLLLWVFYKDKTFFDFSGFEERASRDTHPNLLVRYLLCTFCLEFCSLHCFSVMFHRN